MTNQKGNSMTTIETTPTAAVDAAQLVIIDPSYLWDIPGVAERIADFLERRLAVHVMFDSDGAYPVTVDEDSNEVTIHPAWTTGHAGAASGPDAASFFRRISS
jgi:hypothetical protein